MICRRFLRILADPELTPHFKAMAIQFSISIIRHKIIKRALHYQKTAVQSFHLKFKIGCEYISQAPWSQGTLAEY